MTLSSLQAALENVVLVFIENVYEMYELYQGHTWDGVSTPMLL
jgi:hypothetical protein